MNKVVEELSKIGIVPVIALDDAKHSELQQQRNLSVSWLKSSLNLLSEPVQY